MQRNIRTNLTLTPDNNSVNAILGDLSQRLQRSPKILNQLGQMLAGETRKCFQQQRSPYGTPWAKPHPQRQSTKPLLGSMRNRVGYRLIRENGINAVEVYVNHPWVSVHQFGAVTRPHPIFPRVKQALFWAGAAHPVGRVNHPGSRIPARPFLPGEVIPPRYQNKINAIASQILR